MVVYGDLELGRRKVLATTSIFDGWTKLEVCNSQAKLYSKIDRERMNVAPLGSCIISQLVGLEFDEAVSKVMT